jgi:hypothetical protein
MSPENKIDLKLNQNMWFFVISLATLGFSEHYELEKLSSLSYWLSLFSSILIAVSMFFYSFDYCRKRIKGKD